MSSVTKLCMCGLHSQIAEFTFSEIMAGTTPSQSEECKHQHVNNDASRRSEPDHGIAQQLNLRLTRQHSHQPCSNLSPNHFHLLSLFCFAPCGAGAPLFPLVHLLPHLFPFYFSISFIGFTYFLLCPSLPFLPV